MTARKLCSVLWEVEGPGGLSQALPAPAALPALATPPHTDFQPLPSPTFLASDGGPTGLSNLMCPE